MSHRLRIVTSHRELIRPEDVVCSVVEMPVDVRTGDSR